MPVISHPTLDFPVFDFKIKGVEGQEKIFDPVRKKYVALTPEEWVRQHAIAYLHTQLGYPFGLMAVEKKLVYNQLVKRADIVAYNNSGKPLMIVECKSYEVKMSQDVFHQILRYNLKLKVKVILVTNGIVHHCCRFDGEKYLPLSSIPEYKSITN
jgi:hypothetical protein